MHAVKLYSGEFNGKALSLSPGGANTTQKLSPKAKEKPRG